MEEKVINLEGINPEALEAEEAEANEAKAEEVVEEAPAEAAAPVSEETDAESKEAEKGAEIAPEEAENGAPEAEPEEVSEGSENVAEPAENAPESEGAEAPEVDAPAAPEAVESAEEEVPAEPVVAADAGELEREAKAESEAPKRTARRAPAQRKETSVRERTARKPKMIAEVGTKSDEIEAEEALVKSDKERAEEVYRELLRAQRSGAYLMGEVFAIEPESDAFKNHVVIDVLYNGVKVMIPDIVYFEDSYDFGSTYDSDPERIKAARRVTNARFQTGAKVYFTVSAVSREEVPMPDGNTQTVIIAIGDRKNAMAKVRDTYFFHRNRASETRAPRAVSEGDYAKAHVIAVREDMVLVECLGVETRIDAFNLSNQYVENCRDITRVGKTLDVRIRKLHVDKSDDDPKKDRVFLTVTCRLNDAAEALATTKVRTYVAGNVVSYNKEKGIYSIMLKNGVTAVVNAQDVRGQIDLNPGDPVNVFVTHVLNTHVIGLAAKA